MTEPSRAVFVSYASQDAEPARRICEALRAAGIEVWFDQNELRGGDAWDTQIRKQIHDCALFVPIISANTASRREGYFRLEWGLAEHRSQMIARNMPFIVPICIDGTAETSEDVPESFLRVQWTRLPGGETSAPFCQRITALLAGTEKPIPAPTGGKPLSAAAQPRFGVWLGVAIVGVLVLGAIAWQSWLLFTPKPPTVSVSSSSAASSAGPVPEKSIAVLPFVDLSEKHDQEYFSDGLAEELIDLLSKIPELRVPARTSSFSFKSTSTKVGEIARELNVAHVLEGSVRKAGSRVRITAQLIRADNGYHLWSDTYDRDLEDLFKVQDEIAHAVVRQLQLKILGAVPSASAATANAEAHNLYLQGRYFTSRETPADLNKAIERYQRSLDLDPDYAAAWAWLAYTYIRRELNSSGVVGEGFVKARAAAERAIELGPTIADGFVALAYVQWAYDFNWTAAAETLAKARQIDPNNALAIEMTGHLSRTTASTEETIALFRRSVELDPMNLTARKYLARALYYARRDDEAEATLRQVIDLNPDFQGAHYELGRVLIARGQPAAGLSSFETEKSAWHDLGLPLGYRANQLNGEANAALTTLVTNSAGREFQIAEAYGFFGDADRAFAWLDKARQMHDAGVIWLRGDPLFASLRDDPRYKAFLHRMNLPQ